jgi:hypothetical protein
VRKRGQKLVALQAEIYCNEINDTIYYTRKKPTIRNKETDSLKAFSCLFPVLVHIHSTITETANLPWQCAVSNTCWINTPPCVLKARQEDESDHSPLLGAQV